MAERYVPRALSIDGDRPLVHSWRGFNHFRLNDPAAAGEDFIRACCFFIARARWSRFCSWFHS